MATENIEGRHADDDDWMVDLFLREPVAGRIENLAAREESL